MNRESLIDRLGTKHGNKTVAREMLRDLVEEITAALVRDGFVRIGELGTFTVEDVLEREYNDPSKPGEKVLVPAHKKVRFKPAVAVKRALNQKAQ